MPGRLSVREFAARRVRSLAGHRETSKTCVLHPTLRTARLATPPSSADMPSPRRWPRDEEPPQAA